MVLLFLAYHSVLCGVVASRLVKLTSRSKNGVNPYIFFFLCFSV